MGSVHGVNISADVIRPIGVSLDKPLSEEESLDLIGFGGDYVKNWKEEIS